MADIQTGWSIFGYESHLQACPFPLYQPSTGIFLHGCRRRLVARQLVQRYCRERCVLCDSLQGNLVHYSFRTLVRDQIRNTAL